MQKAWGPRGGMVAAASGPPGARLAFVWGFLSFSQLPFRRSSVEAALKKDGAGNPGGRERRRGRRRSPLVSLLLGPYRHRVQDQLLGSGACSQGHLAPLASAPCAAPLLCSGARCGRPHPRACSPAHPLWGPTCCLPPMLLTSPNPLCHPPYPQDGA